MKAMEEEKQLFEKSSVTYYFSSRFFPKKIRDNVSRLYSFVRLADNYVDEKPAQPKKLLALEKAYHSALADHTFDATAHQWDDLDTRAIKHIVRLQHRYKFEQAWVEDFFSSMKQDIKPLPYETLEESLQYTHGSAEVIGLMMARLMGLPDESLDAAEMQGRAMQWINFVRDIAEDNELGRLYFPQKDLKKFGLKNLSEKEARDNPEQFKKFVQYQLDRYKKWQTEADKGIHYIPERLQVPVRTAVDLYQWTADQIEENPFIVFDKKVRPRKRRVVAYAARHAAKGSSRATVKAAKHIRSGSKKAVPAAKAAVPIVKEKAAETTDALLQKTDEIRDKLPGSKS